MKNISFSEHFLLQQEDSSNSLNALIRLFDTLIQSAIVISKNLNRAGLLDVLGSAGSINVQGEKVQKLDVFANNTIISLMERSGSLCAMASEENENIILVSEGLPQDEYMLLFDPLDGSSNIDVNINVGTIFSILRRSSTQSSQKVIESDILQAGTQQVAAGYFLYGPSTMLIFTAGSGVHGYTFDQSQKQFYLSHPNIKISEKGSIYSTNEGNNFYWSSQVQSMVTSFKTNENPSNKPYQSRYVGSLVADFHRTLQYGGIFMYPLDSKSADKPHGKLRLMYEASPLAFVIEQAGGVASTGVQRILDIKPESLHQRVPLFIGSKLDVEHAISYLN